MLSAIIFSLAMPVLYRYLGIEVLFFSNDHLPIHVHGVYQDCESKAEIFMRDGKVHEIIFTEIKNAKSLPTQQQRDFESLVRVKADEIVQRWIEYFVLQKKISSTTITRRIK
ncbi:MAG: DUF4160 domain-containing protein [Candidatus Kapabacteria bacterium]|nr:DUF4160 domain-containing protein [Candidatus Kapabacteria bacterium]